MNKSEPISIRNALILASPALLALAVNINVLWNGFIWDDHFIVRSSGDPFSSQMIFRGFGHPYYRPVVSWFWSLDRWIWGTNPFGFHLTNLLLHVSVTGLLTLAGLRFFQGFSPNNSRDYSNGKPVVLFSAMLFAVHPVHSEPIAWAAGRNDLLPAFFISLAFVLHLWLRRTGNMWILPGWTIACGLALFSKESVFPLLLLFPLYDLLFWRKPGKITDKFTTPSTFIIFLLMAAYIGFRLSALNAPAVKSGSAEGEVLNFFVTPLYVIGYYLKHLIFPQPLNFYLTFPEAFGPVYLFYCGVGLVFLGVLLYVTFYARLRGYSFALWIMLLGFAAPAAVPFFSVTHAPLAERYLYLPSIGFVFGFSVIFTRLLQRKGISGEGDRAWGKGLMFAGGAVILVLSILSFQRNGVFRDDLYLWSDTAQKSPRAALPHFLLGLALQNESRFEEAEEAYLAALQAKGKRKDHALAANNLGMIYKNRGDYLQAKAYFVNAVEYASPLDLPYFNLGALYWERVDGRWAGTVFADDPPSRDILLSAHDNLIHALELNPLNPTTYYVLGLVNLSLGRKGWAEKSFQKILELAPSEPLRSEALRLLRVTRNPTERTENSK